MREAKRVAPRVLDRLEDRIVLSHAQPAVAAIGLALAGVSSRPSPGIHLAGTVNLAGTVTGFETPSPLVSAARGDLLLTGNGNVAPLGPSHLTGTLSIKSAEPTFYDATVSLSTPTGGVRVHIYGLQGGPWGRPVHLHYTILSGWGTQTGATGAGDVLYIQGRRPTARRDPILADLLKLDGRGLSVTGSPSPSREERSSG